jgi:DNA-binding NarL/FixJ family response regulator
MKITLGIVDDQKLFLRALFELIKVFQEFEVIVEAADGEAFLGKLTALSSLPDIILCDVKMEGMSGPEVVQAIAARFPLVKIIALSSIDDDVAIIRMLRAGCCAYLLKSIDDTELKRALLEVNQTGYYNADGSNIRYRRLAQEAKDNPGIQLNHRETQFLKLACSDLTYKQIATRMNVAERTVDGYRESLFEKLNVQSRVGMALEAIRLDFVQL